MTRTESTKAFLELLRVGLWGKTQSSAFKTDYCQVDFSEVYRIAKEQSVVGLIAGGIEHVEVADKTDVARCIVPKESLLSFVGSALQIEQRNMAMNSFVEQLIGGFNQRGIRTLIVKGQGIAQCYEKPLWRTCGDVDLLLDATNYQKAKKYLCNITQNVAEEITDRLHQGFTIQGWEVELHGTLRCKQGCKIDRMIDEVQEDTLKNNRVRIWKNGTAEVQLPAPDNDVIFVFTHFLEHFWGSGIGLRQICDWCRLLWTYQSRLDVTLLEKRLRQAGLMTEWKAFASLAVHFMGMPKEAMPLYDDGQCWLKKAERVLDTIMETGNMGHNRDMSYQQNYPILVYKMITFYRYTLDSIRHFMIFPKDAIRVWMLRTKERLVFL